MKLAINKNSINNKSTKGQGSHYVYFIAK